MPEQTEETKEKREQYTPKIGPKLKKVLNKQKELIKRATYGECNASEYEAGEIIALKIMEHNLV